MIVPIDLVGMFCNIPGAENTLAAIARDDKIKRHARLMAATLLLAGAKAGTWKIPAPIHKKENDHE